MRNIAVRAFLSVGIVGVLAIAAAATTLAADPIPTSISVTADPPYSYEGDTVELTATISPNPGSGTLHFSYAQGTTWETHAAEPIDPATGTATHQTIARDILLGGMAVTVEFWGDGTYAPSTRIFRVDLRFPPNVVITDAPDATTADEVTVSFVAAAATECRFDGGSWDDCASPVTLSDLEEGHHALDIRAYNPDGRRGGIETAEFDRDLTPPVPGTVRLDEGIASTNTSMHTLHFPATDALSGVARVRVSSVGTLDDDGNLWLDPALQQSRDIAWFNGDSTAWGVDMTSSGPQTTWVQWFDEAGNASDVESVTVDVRSAFPVLGGGLWATTNPTVAFAVTGIDASEIHGVRITNAYDGGPGVLQQATAPTTWSLTDPAAGGTSDPGLKTVILQWKDADGDWSDWSIVLVRLLPSPTADLVIDDGSGVTHDRWVQGWTSIGFGLHQGVQIDYRYSCDGVHWESEYPQGPAIPIDVELASAGCPMGDGPRTIHVRYGFGLLSYSPARTAWSAERTAEVEFQRDDSVPANDATPPIGSVSIAGGAAAVPTSSVTVSVPATDDSALALVRLSNDGTTWTTRTYAASQSWALAAGTGTRRVWARWRDAAGNWSAPVSDTIVVDSTKPTSTTPRAAIRAGSRTTTAGSVGVRIAWKGSDVGAGIARYQVARSVDGGAWSTISSHVTTNSLDTTFRGGLTYRFRVRAIDAAGNVGDWSTSATVRRKLVSDGSSAITYVATWSRTSSSELVGGTERVSKMTGAKARTTVTGRSVGWVATVGPTRGKARVYVDGVAVATVDLYRSSSATRKVVWATSWATRGTHTVTIKVLGTSGRPRVGLDAFVVID